MVSWFLKNNSWRKTAEGGTHLSLLIETCVFPIDQYEIIFTVQIIEFVLKTQRRVNSQIPVYGWYWRQASDK